MTNEKGKENFKNNGQVMHYLALKKFALLI